MVGFTAKKDRRAAFLVLWVSSTGRIGELPFLFGVGGGLHPWKDWRAVFFVFNVTRFTTQGGGGGEARQQPEEW